MIVPSGAARTSTSASRVAVDGVGEHDVGLDARLDAAGVAGRRPGAARRGAARARPPVGAAPWSLDALRGSRSRCSSASAASRLLPCAWPSLRCAFFLLGLLLASLSASLLLRVFLAASSLLPAWPSRSRSAGRAAGRAAPARPWARGLGTGLGGGTGVGRRLRRDVARRGDLRHGGPQLGLDALGLADAPAHAEGQRDDQPARAPAAPARAPRPMPSRRLAASGRRAASVDVLIRALSRCS